MENTPTRKELQECLELVRNIERQTLHFNEVARRQIMSALLREVGLRWLDRTKYDQNYLWEVLKKVANQARKLRLLINPSPYDRQTHSAATGNTDKMHPSAKGWEPTKDILSTQLNKAEHDLTTRLNLVMVSPVGNPESLYVGDARNLEKWLGLKRK